MLQPLKAALDVQYAEPGPSATAACVLFENWTDAEPVAEHRTHIAEVADYFWNADLFEAVPALTKALAG